MKETINRAIIFIQRLHAKHRIRRIIIGITLLVFFLFFLEETLRNAGIIISSIITSYIYNLLADTKKEIEKEMIRIEQEELIR